MADTAIRASATNSSTTGTAISVSAPTGTIAGDVVIVWVTGNGQTTIVDNNGATPFTEDINDYKPNPNGGHTVSLFSRRIIAGDPSTYNFTLGASGRWSIIAVTISDPHPTSIYDVAPSTSNALGRDDTDVGATIDSPTITSLSAGAIHCVCAGFDSAAGTVSSGPSGYTLQATTTNEPLAFSYKVITTPSATGAKTTTLSANAARLALSFTVNFVPTTTTNYLNGRARKRIELSGVSAG